MINSDTIPSIEEVHNTLDKLIVHQLHLMEIKMQHEVNIENCINSGCLNLAKARYIMGQSSVSSTKLPTENSNEFSAAIVCEISEEDGVSQYKIVDNTSGNTVNPLKWFGVLVPQNLHKAQNIFRNTINYIVECANVQMKINSTLQNIDSLKQYIVSNRK